MKRVTIIGFAPSYKAVDFSKDGEFWCINEFYKVSKDLPGFHADRWFEIHSRFSPSKNTEEHISFLQQAQMPVYMQDTYEDIPTSVKFPKDEIIEFLSGKGFKGCKYFTNTITWLIALAVYEGFECIDIYGVDMAANSEYGTQRPSCEYIIGLAEGMGIEVNLAEESDLLKANGLYAFETDNAFRLKIKSRIKELKEKRKTCVKNIQQLEAQKKQLEGAVNQIDGAIEDSNFYLTNWTY